MNEIKKIADKINNDKQNFFLKKFFKVVDHYWKEYVELNKSRYSFSVTGKKQDEFMKDYKDICKKHGVQIQPVVGFNLIEKNNENS